ncbi:MAG: acyl dehydratase [Rhodocyclaceae bacterium]|jgi:hypothetical protein|nr:acyl dehydratase [Rhodocyclaceae bacterium]MBK6552449.1 acyl dehydratase [Rhodocyclaceae bacterium]MBK6675627.1 acyl dehydratase [Rhodocyclaceae bacterium]MBK7814200.1 acyl dehydratase [Rhodocyclaceae bacterium]MBK9311985.1 acyl dehydratase [Rhodocyclaceae bacterium]
MNKTTRRFGSVAIGEKLPPLKIDITSGLIIGGAIASRDFTPVHHDKAAAQAGGLPDIFMNILTSNGLIGRYVTDWAGPDCTIKRIDVKLGAPNLPGFIMTITAEVNARDDAAGTVDIAYSGDNNVWGTHMAGIVRVALPKEA